MSLSNYLQNNKLSYEDFGSLIGATATTVYRYTKGLRVPKPAIMQAISKVTKGEVTANDFYELQKTKRKRSH